ncbi:MAG TPA: tRNA preQ1(34) S-adenosylmethionine ribosyltransferase-isomerase QueA [Candidatus Dojkabacteria bacterium]|nr:tRNA preQ1(34) S-adenosylmethionine ribosyltransferase-isomerase QueA [Candidatus Dojkabacteria bacterium]
MEMIFDYILPENLIANFPPKERGTTRLLVIDRKTGEISHKRYFNVVDYIKPGDVVVLNRTKVINVRTFPIVARTGKKVQLLFLNNIQKNNIVDNEETNSYLERKFGKDEVEYWYALIGRAKNVKIGDILQFKDDEEVEIIHRNEGEAGFIVACHKEITSTIFSKYGHVPLPPYIKRDDNEDDKIRYNTVFAKIDGSVAAPTASLNITDEILNQINAKGAFIAYVELKVSWGTFSPVNTSDYRDFKIHGEYYNVIPEDADIINRAKANGGNVFSFGTTVTRVLESLAENGKIKSGAGYTDIYIYPGYKWKFVDHLVTNFHTPRSSLILLVNSFLGEGLTEKAYNIAIKEGYAFLSYGDSMLII